MTGSRTAGALAPGRGRWSARAWLLAALLALASSLGIAEGLRLAAGPAAQPPLTTGARAGALGAISSALGAEDPAYRFTAGAGAVRGHNRAQRMSVLATPAGVTLRTRRLQVSLSLSSAGFAGAPAPVASAQPAARANRLSFDRGAIEEWYVNGPLGLEQGFTLARAPAGEESRPLTLALSLSGNARPELAPHGSGLTLTGGGERLRYGALSATDAAGRSLPVSLALHGHELLLSVDARGARYPLTIDPLIHQQAEAKLTASGEEGEGNLGYSVALSADGNTALVGGPGDGSYGAVWVFVRSGGNWMQQGSKLQGGEKTGNALESCGEEPQEAGEECNFGRSVALSADGNTALVGNPRESRLEEPSEPGGMATLRHNVGAAWVYTRSGSTWTAQARLTGAEESAAGRFGKSVALSGDGSTALIGGTADRADRGSAWVFTRAGSSWAQHGPKLVPSDEQGEGFFGQSVALSEDGTTAVIGGPGDSGFTGAAWIFTLAESIWFQRGAKLTGSGESGEGRFGYSAAISGDGSTALVGARNDAEGAGAAWAFARSGSSWSAQGGKLTGGGEGPQAFGYSVALSRDGATALVGAPRDGAYRGAVWELHRTGGAWGAAEERLEAGVSETGHASFGSGVALSADGSTRLAGGPRDSGKVGAAWVFGRAPEVLSIAPVAGPRAGGTEVAITGSNFTAATQVHFGAADATSFVVISPETILATSPAGEGAVDVTVSSPYGTSLAGALFHYLGASRVGGAGGTSGTGAGAGASGAPGGSLGVLGFGASGGGAGCRVSLLSRSISVLAHNRAAVRLRVSGAGRCAGKLRLRVTRRLSRHRTQLKTIGTAVFSIPAGHSALVKLKLNAAGRTMLRRHHWRLTASLLVVRQSPAPSLAQTARVRLARPSRHAAKHA